MAKGNRPTGSLDDYRAKVFESYRKKVMRMVKKDDSRVGTETFSARAKALQALYDYDKAVENLHRAVIENDELGAIYKGTEREQSARNFRTRSTKRYNASAKKAKDELEQAIKSYRKALREKDS